MTSETKHHIDAARQILVGVVPNPTSQIDQITNALIYKFMDDMDQAAIKQGGKESFFTGDLRHYSWTRLMDSRIGNQERMNIYSEALVKFSESKQLPTLFREIFKSAFLPYRSPEVLGLFLKEIDFFDYSHPEELGNAYEYLLSVMGSQGDAGQFRTPRHIIDFMVKVVAPTVEDKVLDPACGTGGFLVSAYKHILEQHDGKDSDGKKNDEKPLTPDQRKKLAENFEGYDIDPGMVRIAQVNMYLHQFKNPKIYNYDTLTMEERWGDKFSVILANPPFMSPKGGVSTHSKFSIQSSRSEVLFVDYIINHLRPNGKAGVIVPEGIIFQSGKAHTQLRKNIITDGLYAVVSLPQGVFNPYAGVKTSILFFDNELAKKSKEILFVKIENDGTDLGARKKKVEKNDLPQSVREIMNFRKSVMENTKYENTTISQAVFKSIIIESGDFNLSGDRYNIKDIIVAGNIPLVELGKVLNKRSFRAGDNFSKYEVYTISSEKGGFVPQKDYYSKVIASDDRSNYKIVKKDNFGYRPPGLDIGTIGLNVTNEDLIVSPLYEVFAIKEDIKLLKEFLFIIFKSSNFKDIVKPLMQGAARPLVNWNTFCKIKIPLPPLEIQEQIVKELDGYQNIITSAKQIVYSWKPCFIVDPKWRKVKLPDISENNDNRRKPVTKSDRSSGKYPYYGASGIVDYVGEYIFDGEYLLISEDGANLLARSTPISFSISGKNWVNNHAHILKFKDRNTQKFVEAYINQIDISNFVTGMAQPKLNQQQLNTIEIPFPSLEMQKQIVDRIESESALIEGNKKLIEIYEQKTKDALSKLWEE